MHEYFVLCLAAMGWLQDLFKKAKDNSSSNECSETKAALGTTSRRIGVTIGGRPQQLKDGKDREAESSDPNRRTYSVSLDLLI